MSLTNPECAGTSSRGALGSEDSCVSGAFVRRLLAVDGDNQLPEQLPGTPAAPRQLFTVTTCTSLPQLKTTLAQRGTFTAAIVDVELPDVHGAHAIRAIRRALPGCPVLVLTRSARPEDVLEALRAGACGYLLKPVEPQRVVEAVGEALAGGAPLEPRIARLVVDSFVRFDDELDVLTLREREVLGLLAKGHLYADVADSLSIRLGTVQAHVKSIYSKLEVSSKAEAAAIAARLGLV